MKIIREMALPEKYLKAIKQTSSLALVTLQN